MTESPRDSGLVRAMGPVGLAASILNIVVGAGIFAVPGALAACVGPLAPLAFVACAVVVGAVALCFAEGGSRVPTSGGAYGTIEAAFGPLTGYVAGMLLLVSDVLACGGVAAAIGDVTASLLPLAARVVVRAAVATAVIAGIALVNVGGVARGVWLVRAATALKLVPLLVFVAAGATAIRVDHLVASAPPAAGALGRALILALFTFTGMESSLCASGEVANPSRTIPRALGWAMGSVTLLYVAIQVVAQGVLGPALAGSEVPLADAMARVSPALRGLMLGGAAVSMFGWIGSDILGSPRMMFAFARDGLLPRVLGRVHPRSHAPHVAILSYAALAVVLAWTGTFSELAVLATLASAPLYVAGCAAAWALARRGVARAGEPLGLRGLGLAAAIGASGTLVAVALASRAEIAGLGGFLLLAALSYAAQARGRARLTAGGDSR